MPGSLPSPFPSGPSPPFRSPPHAFICALWGHWESQGPPAPRVWASCPLRSPDVWSPESCPLPRGLEHGGDPPACTLLATLPRPQPGPEQRWVSSTEVGRNPPHWLKGGSRAKAAPRGARQRGGQMPPLPATKMEEEASVGSQDCPHQGEDLRLTVGLSPDLPRPATGPEGSLQPLSFSFLSERNSQALPMWSLLWPVQRRETRHGPHKCSA